MVKLVADALSSAISDKWFHVVVPKVIEVTSVDESRRERSEEFSK
jgi:hypothetical protein